MRRRLVETTLSLSAAVLDAQTAAVPYAGRNLTPAELAGLFTKQ